MNQPMPAPYISPPTTDDTAAENPFAPIVMVPSAGGISAMLGAIEIGQVREHDGGINVRAFWRSFLPGSPQTPKPAPSIEIGQQRLAEGVRDWFAACGHPLPTQRRKP